MIREEYIQFETAKLLKEVGFPQDIKQTMFYNAQGATWHMGDHHWINGYAKPTQTVAMRWLREVNGLTILFELFTPSEVKGTCLNAGDYTVDIYDSQSGLHLFSVDELCAFPTYEAAAEAGIQAACRYLIEKGGEE